MPRTHRFRHFYFGSGKRYTRKTRTDSQTYHPGIRLWSPPLACNSSPAPCKCVAVLNLLHRPALTPPFRMAQLSEEEFQSLGGFLTFDEFQQSTRLQGDEISRLRQLGSNNPRDFF